MTNSESIDEHVPAADKPTDIKRVGQIKASETKTRGGLVWALLAGYFILLAVGITFAAFAEEPSAVVDRVLSAALPTLTGFLGTALGFYFGDKRERK